MGYLEGGSLRLAPALEIAVKRNTKISKSLGACLLHFLPVS